MLRFTCSRTTSSSRHGYVVLAVRDRLSLRAYRESLTHWQAPYVTGMLLVLPVAVPVAKFKLQSLAH